MMVCSRVLRMTLESSVDRLSVLPLFRRWPAHDRAPRFPYKLKLSSESYQVFQSMSGAIVLHCSLSISAQPADKVAATTQQH